MSQISLQEIYVAYFGRAADPAGLNYWLGQETAGSSDALIALQFVPQPETLGLYPLLNSPALLAQNASAQTTFINSVYMNLFGHPADPAGLAFWQSQLTGSASVPPANPGLMVFQVIGGALGADATSILNRATVAQSYTNAVGAATNPTITWNPATDVPQSRTIINTITASSATVTAANASIAAAIVKDQGGLPGNTLTLTGGPDTFTLTSPAGSQTTNNNDVIRGFKGGGAPGAAGFSELTSFDTIQEGSGNSVMNAALDNEVTVTAALQNVKTVNISPGVNGQTFSGASTSGETLVGLAGGQFGGTAGDAPGWLTTVTNITTGVALGMSNATGFAENLNATFTNLAASGNVASLVLNNNSGGTFGMTMVGGNGVNTLNVQSNGTANSVQMGAIDTALTTENITGSASLTQIAAGPSLTMINGAAATGALNITADPGSGPLTMIGGSGADILNATGALTAVTLNGGLGNDTLIFEGKTAANTLTGGGGSDTMLSVAGGMKFISVGDATSASTLAADVDVVTDYTAGSTVIDIKGGGPINTLTGTQLSAVAASTNLLTATQLAGVDAGAKGLVAFAFGSNEYILQLNTSAAFQAGDGLMQLNNAASTFRATDLTNA